MLRQGTGRRAPQGDVLTPEQYEALPLIYFDQSRNESKPLPQHFKILQQNMKTMYRFATSKEFLSTERVKPASVVVLAGPREIIDEQDGLVLAKFMEQGGLVLILGSEGSDPSSSTAGLINAFTDPLGISLKDNAVVRTVYHKECFHPKEVYISKPALSDSFAQYVQQHRPAPSAVAGPAGASGSSAHADRAAPLAMVFPYGCSLTASEPAMPLLSSGPFSLPPQVPTGAIARYGAGFLVVLGSTSVFEDEYIEKADNLALARAIFGLATDRRLEIGLGDEQVVRTNPHGTRALFPIATATSAALRPTTSSAAGAPQRPPATRAGGASVRAALDGDAGAGAAAAGVNLFVDPGSDEAKGDWAPVPDTEALAGRLRPCLQESDELPSDMLGLVDPHFSRLDNSLIPEAVALFQRLGVEHAQLSLVRPVLELSYPRVQPAAFMPLLLEAPPPELDLFDLDEQFADDRLRLAQLTNKCGEKDLDFFVEEAANILGIADALRSQEAEKAGGAVRPGFRLSAKDIIAFVAARIVQLKRIEDAPGKPAEASST